MRLKAISFYSRVLSFFLVLLGFSSCSDDKDDEMWVEYGSPSATYVVKGKVVSSENEKPTVRNIRALVIENVDESKQEYPLRGDTVFTKSDGSFEIVRHDYASRGLKLKLQDIDGEDNGLFEDKEIIIDLKNVTPEGASGWYNGKYTKDLGNVELTPKNNE